MRKNIKNVWKNVRVPFQSVKKYAIQEGNILNKDLNMGEKAPNHSGSQENKNVDKTEKRIQYISPEAIKGL